MEEAPLPGGATTTADSIDGTVNSCFPLFNLGIAKYVDRRSGVLHGSWRTGECPLGCEETHTVETNGINRISVEVKYTHCETVEIVLCRSCRRG